MLARYDLTPFRLVFLGAVLLFFGAFLLYPLVYVLQGAFVVDGRFTLEFFGLMLGNPAHVQAVLNSINLALVVTATTTLLSVPLAWATVRHDFAGKGLVGGLLLVPMVLPPFVGAVGMRQIFARFGSLNLLLMDWGIIDAPIDFFGGGGVLGVVLMETLHLYPIMYLNVAAALANVDPSMEEAGRNAGASGFTLFRRITFPLMLPGYFAGASIVFIWAFTDLGTPLVFEYRQVVPVQIFDMLSDIHENPVGYALVVLMVALSLLFFYLSKALIGGKRYETVVRGHVASAAKPATPLGTVLIWGGVGLLTLAALVPHLSVGLTSVAEKWFLSPLPQVFTGHHYTAVFEHPLTTTAIRNSLFLSALSTLVDVAAGICLAYLLARTRIPGKNVLDVLTMLPLAVPGIIIAFGYVAGFSGTFLDARVNPVPLLILGYAIRRLPYMVRSAYAGFQQTPVTLEEAAQNVGATPAQTLRRITLPLVFANLVAGAVLCFSFAMLEVSDSLILAAEEQYYPITKAIYALMARPDGPYIASALGMLGMVLLSASLFLAGRFMGRRMGDLFRA